MTIKSEYWIPIGLALAVIGYFVWREFYAIPPLGTNPGQLALPAEQSPGLNFLTYNNTFNPGPPIGMALPPATSGLTSQSSCECAQPGGRF